MHRGSPGPVFQRETVEIAPSMYWGALTIGPDGAVMAPTDKGVAINEDGRWSSVVLAAVWLVYGGVL